MFFQILLISLSRIMFVFVRTLCMSARQTKHQSQEKSTGNGAHPYCTPYCTLYDRPGILCRRGHFTRTMFEVAQDFSPMGHVHSQP